ncbi:hypothetical protein BH20ACT22_BH20ACT22_15950 [soil metagenome]
MTDGRRTLRTLVALGMLGALLTGCSGSDGANGSSGGAVGGGSSEEDSVAQRQRSASQPISEKSLDVGGVPQIQSMALPTVAARVIKTADLEVAVPDGDFRSALTAAVEVARRHGGFVLSTSVEAGNAKSGRLVIRVPAESFERALTDIESLGDVGREVVSGEDVSQEFVDLQARLRNAEAQEKVLLKLMDRSKSVQDTIDVQRELQTVQLLAEQLDGRLRYLEDQTSFSTITLALDEKGAPAVASSGVLQQAWNNATKTFFAVVSAVILGAGFALPLVILLAIMLLIVRLVRPFLPWRSRSTPAQEA